MKRNHGIDYGPVPAHAWSFLELGSAPLAIDHFVWLSHKHGTVFLPTSLHQLLYRLLTDNLKLFYLPNLSHHFELLSHIFVPCPRSHLAYAMSISTFYYYYYYYYYYQKCTGSWTATTTNILMATGKSALASSCSIVILFRSDYVICILFCLCFVYWNQAILAFQITNLFTSLFWHVF